LFWQFVLGEADRRNGYIGTNNEQFVTMTQPHLGNYGTNPAESLPTGVELTHVNLNDGCVEGLRVSALRAFSVQYHPEAAPGPYDSNGLFDESWP